MFKTLEFPGVFAPLAPYQGFALDPLGALSGPQTPRPIILHPPFLLPGYGPGRGYREEGRKKIVGTVLKGQGKRGGQSGEERAQAIIQLRQKLNDREW